MSSRFFQKYFLRCGHCESVQRYAKGYKPIPNPILFNSESHCSSFHNEQRDSVGMVGRRVTCRCDGCQRVHSQWKVMDFQEFIDAKLSMSIEDRKALRYTLKRGEPEAVK